MNMQAIMRQANKMKKDMEKKQEKLKSKEFETKNEFVHLILNGEKNIVKFEILKSDLDSDDFEILEDMIILAFNNCYRDIDTYTESEFGQYNDALGGMF